MSFQGESAVYKLSFGYWCPQRIDRSLGLGGAVGILHSNQVLGGCNLSCVAGARYIWGYGCFWVQSLHVSLIRWWWVCAGGMMRR